MGKKRSVAVGLLTALLVLSGCAGEAERERVHITLMHGWGGSAPDHVAMRKIYDDFQAQNPEIVLDYVSYPDITIVLEKANDMLALGQMPDIISTNGYSSFVDGACRKGLALDLAPYLDADPDFSACVSEASLNAWREPNGGVYTLSDAQEIAGYWYNEDILRQAGVVEGGKVHLPTTWEEFWTDWQAVADWNAEQGGEVVPAALSLFQTKSLFGALIAASGSEGTAFMKGKRADCPKAVLAAALDGVAKAYAMSGDQTVSENNARQLFFEGNTAFFFGGVWSNTELEQTQKQQNIKYAAFPGPEGQTVSYVTPSSGYVVSNTGSEEKIEACVRFVSYMLSTEVQQRIAAESRQAPSNPAVDAAWITERVPVLGQALDACYQAPIHIIALPTLLDEKANLIIDACLKQPHPSQESVDAVLTILS